MKAIGIGILVAWTIVLTASVALYGESESWLSRTEDRALTPDERLQEEIAQGVAENDRPFSWVPIAAGAGLLGSGIAAVVLFRGRKEDPPPRTEDEAWADLLGPDAI